MSFDPVLAEIRFGNGLSPHVAPPSGLEDMLTRLAGDDLAAGAFHIPKYSETHPSRQDFKDDDAALREASTDEEIALAQAARQANRDAVWEVWAKNTSAQLNRDITTQDGFRERLVRFWADHFTSPPTNGQWRYLCYPDIEEHIRPFVAAKFEDLLKSAIMSPMLVRYLNQDQSIGPNSQRAERRGHGGLNENLAREVLELHTLGVDGAYTQDDVRQFAELLTGLTASNQRETYFDPALAEPGPETLLGQDYGGPQERLDWVMEALGDLARHPDTARHIVGKLITHFLGPEPQADLAEAMAREFERTGGDLLALYRVMLSHDAAWQLPLQKVKLPYDFMASSMRALAVPSAEINALSSREIRRMIWQPLTLMGQQLHQPLGPDGWPEEAEHWITPQGMAMRITWAMQTPTRLLTALPNPIDFAHHALGPSPDPAVIFAAQTAEDPVDGIGVILASAAFQRR